jgi:hypothetical protein
MPNVKRYSSRPTDHEPVEDVRGPAVPPHVVTGGPRGDLDGEALEQPQVPLPLNGVT